MSTKHLEVAVLGAGIVGASVARELQARGKNVTLIDKGDPGFGCSYGNAGWITPCFATPLPQPGMLVKAMKWLLDPESPLYIQPHADRTLFKWLLRFMRNMNSRQMHESIDVLTAISSASLEWYQKLSERHSEIGFLQNGLLNVCETGDSLAGMAGEMEIMAEHGIEGKLMSAEEVTEFEPSVRQDKITGGVFYPNEAHAEPLATVRAIISEFSDMGGTILSGHEVYDFTTDGKKITNIQTTRGQYSADLIVWALGSWSEHLGQRLDLNIPILGGKGYAMIVPDSELHGEDVIKPQHSIMIVDRKIAVTPRDNSLRLAGTLELVKMDMSITPIRVQAILKGSREFLHLPDEFNVSEVWRGLRPCTPDGVPVIGFSEYWDNLFYCAGHQMLGLQSAPGSALLAGQLIDGEHPYVDPHPFRAERF